MESDFATWLMREIEIRGWTNAELARRAGRSTSAIGVQPSLPLPSDEMDDWMPVPSEYQISEPAEAGDGRDW